MDAAAVRGAGQWIQQLRSPKHDTCYILFLPRALVFKILQTVYDQITIAGAAVRATASNGGSQKFHNHREGLY